ncbi:HD-GYP domain-containing protein [Thermodesulfovibrio thiophilus]|uniref:HD-GYP domain-containing protein n=1 Tax=Thermodesulfovibrio thiophilus TaxID=340095 RepID=UPI0003FFEA3E|nr:HD domain-containing phosphohydrolase [Thermodesulfovibrio thiophilus]
MKIYWICLQNTFKNRESSVSQGIEPIFAYPDEGQPCSTVVEAKSLTAEVLSIAQRIRGIIFIEGCEVSSLPLSWVKELARLGLCFFWDINDLILYFKFLDRLNRGCPIDRLTFEIDRGGHSLRTSELAVRIAKEIGFDEDAVKLLKVSAVYHDIGKICIPQSLLHSTKWFNDIEREFVKAHAIWGAYLISKLNLLDEVKYLAGSLSYSHHERLDGSGYPEGKKADEINLSTRIIMVADVYEALRSSRSYRSQCDRDLAVSYLKAKQNLFDKKIVQVLDSLIESKALEWL